MTNIIAMICTTLCGILVGSYLQSLCKVKRDFCADLVKYASSLRVNVQSKQLTIAEFNNDFAKNCSAAFADFLRGAQSPLGKSDRVDAEKFFDGIACLSADELIKHIDFYLPVLDEMRVGTQEDFRKKGSLYVKLGALCGVMTGILFL